MEDSEVLNYGIGMSNIVPRTTRSASELSRSHKNTFRFNIFTLSTLYRKEIKDWSIVMTERMQELNPLIICFNGKGANAKSKKRSRQDSNLRGQSPMDF